MQTEILKFIVFISGLALVLAACNSSSTRPDANDPVQPPAPQIEKQAEIEAVEPDEVETDSTTPIEVAKDNDEPALKDSDNLLAESEPVEIERDPDVPPLPFPDNPDPALCGIPQPWVTDEPAYLSGIYEGELIQPIVFLYDSHLRRKVVAKAPHGTEVKILLSQSNPELNYFLVKIVGAEQPNEGWIPAPFVSFEEPPQL